METLQKHVDYCFLSTRIARFFPGFSDPADASAIAYLVDSNECNEDVTNYWIFSDAGLRRILSRTGWEIRALQLSSQMSDSDPISPDRDQRAFCLLQANRARAWLGVTLTRGWHELESGQFRWTEKTFGLRALRSGLLRIRLFLPDALLPAGKSIVLTASASGKEIGRQEFTHPGAYNVAIRIDKPGEVIFKTNFALGPDQNDSREKGLIVGSAEIWQESDTSQED